MAQMFSSRAIRLLLVMALLGAGSCNNSGGGSAGDTISCGAAECRLVASDAFADDGFGGGVGIAADVIAVGSPRDDDLGSKSGAVYVYRQMGTQWIEEQKLLAGDGAADDQFGAAIAMDDDLIVVGARFHDSATGVVDAGAVYVFRFSVGSWTEEQRLEGDDDEISFGASLDVEDDLIVVGAPKDSDDGLNSGAVYVFRYNAGSWVRELKIKPLAVLDPDTDPAGDPPDNIRESDGFGTAVSIDKDNGLDPDKDVIVVGAPGDDVLIQRFVESNEMLPNADWQGAGTVYVFRSNSTAWVQEDRIFAQRLPRIAPNTGGLGCQISGTSPFVREEGSQPDVLYLDSDHSFRSDKNNNALFGESVSVDNGVLAVGSSRHDRFRGTDLNVCDVNVKNGTDTGSGYVYRYNSFTSSWDFQAQIEVSDNGVGAFTGESIDIDGETIVMSRRVDSQTAENAGAVYVFRYDGSEWLEDEKVRASDGQAFDAFGGSLAVDGGTVIVGAARTALAGPLSGSAYAIGIDVSP